MIADVTPQAVTINGEPGEVPYGARVPDVLRALGMDPGEVRGVAVAVNDEVIPKREWADFIIGAGDRVEVVTAKQGG